MGSYSHLFTPFTIGGIELRNRIVMLPMTTGYAEHDQTIGDRLVDYYAARARGGAGLIIAPVSPSPAGSPVDAGLYGDRFIPGARRLTQAVHEHGAKISALLIVCYHLILPAEVGGTGAPEVVGPSPVTNALLRVVPRELTPQEIDWLVAQYGRAAGRAKKAGFDMVEIMAGGGYLVNRFLSPLSNTRTDRYGGDIEKRTLFLREIIASVREAVGTDFPVTVRLNLQENIEGGYDIDEAISIARILEATGIAGFTTYVGRHESPIPTVQASVPKAGFVHLTERLKQAVGVPVTAANRINDPLVADRILADGRADLVGMGRALLADPELPNKAHEDRGDEIVPCLACSNCLAAMLTTYKQWGQPASAICFVNPIVGRERDAALERAATPKKVTVIGGGPAGLEAARVAALRGHDVTLYEEAGRAGGRLLMGAIPPYKEAIGALADSLVTRARRAGVTVLTGRRAGRLTVERELPDALIVAVGGVPRLPDIPGADGPGVVLAEDVLTGTRTVSGSVVVVGGGMVGCETAESVWRKGGGAARERVVPGLGGPSAGAELGAAGDSGGGADAGDESAADAPGEASGAKLRATVGHVTVIEMLDRMAANVSVTSRPFFLARLRQEGIDMITGARVAAIGPEGVSIVRTVNEAEVRETIPADSVILATGYAPDSAGAAEFAGLVPETHVIGDCAEPRMIREAMVEGYAAGSEV